MFKLDYELFSKIKAKVEVNKTTILCTIGIVSIVGLSIGYGTRLDLKLKKEAIQELHMDSPEQLAELKNLSNQNYLDEINIESNLVYYDESININTVDEVLNCFVELPIDLQRLTLGTRFKIKLTQFLDEVDGVTFYADRVMLIEEFGSNVSETTYHEFGHLLHVLGDINNRANRLNEIYRLESQLYDGKMKNYITSSSSEYYAGSFLEYMINPKELQKNRPKTFKIIEEDINSLASVSTKDAVNHLNGYIKFGEHNHE